MPNEFTVSLVPPPVCEKCGNPMTPADMFSWRCVNQECEALHQPVKTSVYPFVTRRLRNKTEIQIAQCAENFARLGIADAFKPMTELASILGTKTTSSGTAWLLGLHRFIRDGIVGSATGISIPIFPVSDFEDCVDATAIEDGSRQATDVSGRGDESQEDDHRSRPSEETTGKR